LLADIPGLRQSSRRAELFGRLASKMYTESGAGTISKGNLTRFGHRGVLVKSSIYPKKLAVFNRRHHLERSGPLSYYQYCSRQAESENRGDLPVKSDL